MKYLILSLILLSGCASFNSGDSSERMATMAATSVYIKQSNDPARRAERIITIADELVPMLELSGVTLDRLVETVIARIPEDYTPEQRILATEMINAVAASLRDQVGVGAIPADQKFRVTAVLDAIRVAAEAYRGVR